MRRLRGHISRPQEKPQSATTGGGREGGVGWVQNVGAGGVKCMGGPLSGRAGRVLAEVISSAF